MKKYNSEFKSMIFELYKTGPSVKELSREYGVSEVTIYKCFNRIFPIGSIDDTEITLEQIKRIKQVILSYGSLSINIKRNMILSSSVKCYMFTYYRSKNQTESKWQRENGTLIERIKEVYFESKWRYGAIKGNCQLIKEGFSVSLKRVQRLMKSNGLASIIQKKYTLYKPSKELVLER